MSEKNTTPVKDIPIYQGEEGDTSQLVGWASKEADGVYAPTFTADYAGDINNVWFGEPDPDNAPAPVEVPDESQSEAAQQPEPQDSAPVEVKKK